jgi:hypothetical protein
MRADSGQGTEASTELDHCTRVPNCPRIIKQGNLKELGKRRNNRAILAIMAPPVTLQPYQVEDLQRIRDLGPETMRAVVSQLAKVPLVPMPPGKLFETLAGILAENKDAANCLMRETLTLQTWIRHAGWTAHDTVEGIRHALKADFSWTDHDIERWQAIAPAFGELLALPLVHLVASSIDLSYEYANLWQDARILTDIRPIFNPDASEVQGAVVSHALRLQFVSADGSREFHVAMDEADIRALAAQCDRALRKARIARDLMNSKAKVPTLIAGESENA